MKWSVFKAGVDELLAVERRRLGAQPFIDRMIRQSLGHVQRLIPYYRKGIVSTFEHDDVESDGFASKLRLPASISIREIYHVKVGSVWVRRPIYTYPFANRNDLRAGVVTSAKFCIAIDPRGARDAWVYPAVTAGYVVQIVWDAIVGRSDFEFLDDDEVPFDEPVQSIVYDYVKSKLSIEVDKDGNTAAIHDAAFRKAISFLNMEVEERLRLRMGKSDATCLPSTSCGSCGVTTSNCSCITPIHVDGYSDSSSCPTITMPFTEWVMVGDSGDQSSILDTISVASAIRALDPEFVVHLGDCAYGTDKRPGDIGSSQVVGSSSGGSPQLIQDLFLRHYWSFKDGNLYLAFGNHDLESQYGAPLLKALPTVSGLIGASNVSTKLYRYEFARGPVRFFVLNSGSDDSDVNIQLGTQLSWLTSRTAVASEPWLVVVFHRPARTSDATHYPGSLLMRNISDQLASIGIDLVVSAHAHNYERFLDQNGLTHIVCGLGGAPKRGQAGTINLPGSQFFFNGKNGFVHFKADASKLQWTLKTIDGEAVDTITLEKVSGEVVVGTPLPTYTVYSGRSASTILNEAGILALTPRSTSFYPGVYSVTSGSGYVYFCVPVSQTAPSSFMLGFFSTPMAGVSDGYTDSANGINFKTITVSGVPCRLYRTFNALAGDVELNIS
jgi:hypothetical protein